MRKRSHLVFALLLAALGAACHDPRQAAVSGGGSSSEAPRGSTARGEGVEGLVTAGGKPVADLLVTAASLDQPTRAIPELAVLTGADGRYFWPLSPGRYRLSVSPEGFQSASGTATVEAGRRAVVNFELARGR
jgi:antitoxin (DNA-binding transcriptional repressor) of toxin-antitoxin stability system